MKERPILFSGEMVRAILDGRKTMTRRVVKFQHTAQFLQIGHHLTTLSAFPASNGGWMFYSAPANLVTERMKEGDGILCPYGQPGDRLWVRETWCISGTTFGAFWVKYRADESEEKLDGDHNPPMLLAGQYRPSIFMPRWASRITLELTAVRAERVQDISPKDAEAEAPPFPFDYPPASWVSLFRALWDSLNAKRGYGWDANPWVWVIEFRRLP